MPVPIAVVHGRSPIVLVAPHAGRRDPTRRPWGSAPLRMNDLYTGDVARDLAARLDASALVNDAGDRNDIDLARIGAAHDHAPHFLETLAALLGDAIARHGHAVLLTVHGWNVVQPAVDIGLGAVPSAASIAGDGTAVSPTFATTVLPALLGALAARGVAATPGLRYPARARENLLQLFTRRHREDPRPLVRALATLGGRVDALQLELGLPLRLPGRWRDGLVAALVDVLGHDDHPELAVDPRTWSTTGACDVPIGLEFVAPAVSGLAALDARGARLLLFPGDGRLFTFTGERVGRHHPHQVAGLRLEAQASGHVLLTYEGPMLAFPDTTPFLDLEPGLARATIVDARVAVELSPLHRADDVGCPAGRVVGHAVLGGAAYAIDGHGVRSHRARRDVRMRGALRFDDDTVVVAEAPETGFVCRGGTHTALAGFAAQALDGGEALRISATSGDGRRLDLRASVAHRLPVVFGGSPTGRLSFVACRAPHGLAGWLEMPSP